VLHAGIERIELLNVTNILSYFPLNRDIHAVKCDETALGVIRMASELNPDAAGLRSLLARAQATVDEQGTTEEDDLD